MESKRVLLVHGGGGEEHTISAASAAFFEQCLAKIPAVTVHTIEITPDGTWRNKEGASCHLQRQATLIPGDAPPLTFHFAIPCLHGFPGESGEMGGLLTLLGLPFLGSDPGPSSVCFDKATTKLWARALGLPVTPFVTLNDSSAAEMERALAFFEREGNVFVKASSQGSSVGIFRVNERERLAGSIEEAFNFSPRVLVERAIKGRELEVAAYQYNDRLETTPPGEILCPGGFYDYREKYDKLSRTKTRTIATDIDVRVAQKIKQYSERLFRGLHLRHLCRIDFFLDEEGELFFNECNTFPGHTPISMFPAMMQTNGLSYADFLKDIIVREALPCA